ncbi:capsid assembly protein [Propionispora hippei]|uniref:Phage T7 capsid assembly protein n=1 Tax=Propionispora hippei DSM 15287 TaxID=1123003 RepID=A0A1M6MGQ8_9FIRM|nr:hypothetical protein [Propionispora hippei]SHJ82513.1 Phage T7 capsid assembly protein [Propionispora hippei DSM 15287]
MADVENIYGDNAIVGNKEDAEKALEGRDVQITTTNTQTVNLKTEDGDGTVKTDDTPKDDTKDGDNKQPDTEVTPEKQLETDIKTQIQAEEDAKKDLAAKGVDFNAIAAEYEANGTLSADTLSKLEKAGYPKSVVDAYIAGMEATAARFEAQVYEYAGGKEAFQQMTQFVQGLGNEYVNAFNRVIETGDLTQIRIAIQGFKAQMTAKYGTANRTIMGKGNTTTGVQGFTSREEMVKAMSDPRYLRDPGYTREVQEKTMKSTFMR